MATLTRRRLIRQTTLGTAAASALLMGPRRVFAHNGSGTGTSATGTLAESTWPEGHESIGAYVHNVASGEITLLLGSRELTIRDPDLVRRLVLAAR